MKKHNWSGWPGAYCLKCGAEDPHENAIALGWLDLRPGEDPDQVWDTPEHRLEVEKADICWAVLIMGQKLKKYKCVCAEGSHSVDTSNPVLKYFEEIVGDKGEEVPITVARKGTFLVPWIYIAMHGIKFSKIDTYGFKELKPLDEWKKSN